MDSKKDVLTRCIDTFTSENKQKYDQNCTHLQKIVREAFNATEYQDRSIDDPLFSLSALLRTIGYPVSFLVIADQPEDQGGETIPNGAWLRMDNMSYSRSLEVFSLLNEFYENRTTSCSYAAQLTLTFSDGQAVIQNLGREYLTEQRGDVAAVMLTNYSLEIESFTFFIADKIAKL